MIKASKIIFLVVLVVFIFVLTTFERTKTVDRFILPSGFCKSCIEQRQPA